MNVFHYHPETKEYIGSTDAKLDPKELKDNKKEVYMLPFSATFLEPPKAEVNKARIFDNVNEKWITVDDFRGQTMYLKETGEAVTITALGTIPDELTILERPSINHIWDYEVNSWVEDIETIKAQEEDAVKASLTEIDIKTIRAIRDYLDPNNTEAEKAEALGYISSYNASAKTERTKLSA